MKLMSRIRFRRPRWGDNDRNFGPFTYARDTGYRHCAVVLSSGCDEYPGCQLRVSGFGHTLILALPAILRPYRERVCAKSWDAKTVERLGRDWYWSIDERKIGFTYSAGHLSFQLGRSTMDSSTDRSWGLFLPWTQWRHVRHSFYGLNGEHVATLPDTGKSYRGDLGRFARERAIADATPTVSFEFDDFDGERIIAKTKIEEREWRFGTGYFKWLSWFRKPKISRDLDIVFSAETGSRKGSWKGGTIGHSIEMLPGELHASAFKRYCAENKMVFIGLEPVNSEGETE